MNKIVCLLFALMMVFCTVSALAIEIDWAGLSADELNAVIDGAKTELTKRDLLANGNVLLYDDNDIVVKLENVELIYGSLYINYVFTNGTDNKVTIRASDLYINGWRAGPSSGPSLEARKKAKSSFLVLSAEACEVSTIEDIEEIELTLNIYESDSFKDIEKGYTVTVNFK